VIRSGVAPRTHPVVTPSSKKIRKTLLGILKEFFERRFLNSRRMPLPGNGRDGKAHLPWKGLGKWNALKDRDYPIRLFH